MTKKFCDVCGEEALKSSVIRHGLPKQETTCRQLATGMFQLQLVDDDICKFCRTKLIEMLLEESRK